MDKMKSSFAIIADNQFLPGYCTLLRYPKVDSLLKLKLEECSQYPSHYRAGSGLSPVRFRP